MEEDSEDKNHKKSEHEEQHEHLEKNEEAEHREQRKDAEEDKKIHESKKKEQEKLHDKQLRWAIVLIVVILLGFAGSFWFIQNMKKFEYAGLEWSQIKQGQITFYHAQFPFFEYNYNVYFRTDPRKNKIEVNVSEFKFQQTVVFGFDKTSLSCPDAGISNLQMGQFFGVTRIKIETGTTDEEIAKEANASAISCAYSNENNKTVIIVQKSNQTSIIQDNKYPNCYIMNIGECENLKTTERFLTAVITEMNKEEI